MACPVLISPPKLLRPCSGQALSRNKIIEFVRNKETYTEELLAKYEEKSEQYDALAKEYQRLGKRRQHYLNQISKKKK